ncbi:MAG: energy transducer TonB, partial [Bacteroidia bacterium]
IGLKKFLAQNTVYPKTALENNEQGTVIVQFVVNSIGKTEKFEVVNSNEHSIYLEAEAIRVINATSYIWNPATVNGFPVNMRYRIPVMFQIF